MPEDWARRSRRWSAGGAAAALGARHCAHARRCRQSIALPQGCIDLHQDGLQDPQCACEDVHRGSGERMPEDWAQESALISDCTQDVLRDCATVNPGYARMYTCLQ